MKKFLLIAIATMLAFTLPAFAAEDAKRPTLAPLCKNCHQPDSNMMRGFLENIAYKSNTIQMDLMTHKEIIKFNDCTVLKNVGSIEDLKNYKGKGFRITFAEKNGEKIAVMITRFDILQSILPQEKLTKEDLKKLMAEKKNTMLIDARPPMVYQAGHIPGAKLLPAPDFDKYYPQVLPQDKNTPLVFYCVGGCLSPTAAMRAKTLGYKNVYVYTEGFPDWSATEYAVTAPVWLKAAIEKDLAYVLIDIRPKAEVATGHIKTAVSIPLAELDAAKAGFPKQKNAPLIFYGKGKEDAAKKALSWGYKAVRILPSDYVEWKQAGNPVSTGAAATTINYVPKPKPGTISPAEFRQIAAKSPVDTVILDVRGADEAAEGRIRNSINIPNDELIHRLREIPVGKKVVVHCSTGVRAEMAFNALKDAKISSRYLDNKIDIKKDGTFVITEE